MPEKKFKVVVTDYAWPNLDIERGILEPVGAELVEASDRSEEALSALVRDADAILTNWAQLTEKVIRSAEKCLVVTRYGVGLDNIPVDLCTELGIVVTHVPDYCLDEVSDHALLLLLALNRRLFYYTRIVKEGKAGQMDLGLNVVRLRGKKLGIIGFGRIGRMTAEKARAFGMDILVFDPYVSEEQAREAGAELRTLDDLLKESDFVTIHAPLTPETRGLIGERELGLMKPTAFLINVARGAIVDDMALYRACKEGRIAGAGVDVLPQDPPPADHPLLTLENVIVTPHVAFFSQQSLQELARRCAQQVADVLTGRMPERVVNPQVLEKARAKLAQA